MGKRYRNKVKSWQSKRKDQRTVDNLAQLMFGNFKGLAEQQSISQAIINAYAEVLSEYFGEALDFKGKVQAKLDEYMKETAAKREAEQKARETEASDLPEMDPELAREIAEHNNAIDIQRAMEAEAMEE